MIPYPDDPETTVSSPTLPPQTGSFDPVPDNKHFELQPNQVCIVDLSGTVQWRSAWQAKKLHANNRYTVARIVDQGRSVNLFAFYSNVDSSYVATQYLPRTYIDRVNPPDFLRDYDQYVPYFGRKKSEYLDVSRPIAGELLVDAREAVRFAKDLDTNRHHLLFRWS